MSNGNGRRRTDVTRLSFPLQLVAVIVVSAVTAMGSVYAMRDRIASDQQKIASDVRDILTRMEAAARLEEEKAKLADKRAELMEAAISEVKKEQRLMDINIRAVNEGLIMLKGTAK